MRLGDVVVGCGNVEAGPFLVKTSGEKSKNYGLKTGVQEDPLRCDEERCTVEGPEVV